jgi:hypothetical protein
MLSGEPSIRSQAPAPSRAALLNAHGHTPRVVALTFDTDWVPEFVLEALCDTLTAAGAPATVFATDPSPALRAAAARGDIEVGWHPNFAPGSSHGSDEPSVLATLRAWYPAARGVRTHGLVQSSNLLRRLHAAGLVYDASTQLLGHPFLQPVRTTEGLWRLPYHWSDASHVLAGLPASLDALGPDLPGLAILGWHPIHWYLNLSAHAQYLAVREAFPALRTATREALDAWMQPGPGMRTLLRDVLQRVHEGQWRAVTLDTIAAVCEAEVRAIGGWRAYAFDERGSAHAATGA